MSRIKNLKNRAKGEVVLARVFTNFCERATK